MTGGGFVNCPSCVSGGKSGGGSLSPSCQITIMHDTKSFKNKKKVIY